MTSLEAGANLALQAPAKINLVLEVLGRRPDGFHELDSVFAPLAFADRLSVRMGRRHRPVPPADHDRLVVVGATDVPVEGNLVLRAADLLRREAGRPLPGLRMRLVKRVPAAAGLGGGSSDALAALDLAVAAWRIRLGRRRRLQLAADLGSDVPFFAVRGWARVRGRGERVTRLAAPSGGPLGVLLLVPSARLRTSAVFAAFDDLGAQVAGAGSARGAARGLAAALRRGATAEEIAALEPANDLLPAAASLAPGLASFRSEVSELLGRPVHLSGSGPALAVLYPSRREARQGARVVRGVANLLTPPGGGLTIHVTTTGGGDR